MLYESGEDYLETILLLYEKNGSVRSIDIAHELGYSKPSISRAMGILKKNEYITMDKNGLIELTPKGHEKAAEVYERHRLISRFLQMTLRVDADTADTDACRIEHIISRESFDRLRDFVEQNS